ncbi:MAG: M15 family metallopeptidase [Lysobacter sp.]
MSHRLFQHDVLFFQRLLAAEGLYRHALDGLWGRHTEAAAIAFEAQSADIREALGEFDQRSEQMIRGLALRAQREARAFMRRLADHRLTVRIISGTRTYDEQNQLFRRGRFGNPGPVVTKARGGRSNHNFGIAWDIGLFSAGGGYSLLEAHYIAAAREGMSPELEWGGDWPSFRDVPHYQLALNLSLASVRKHFEAGRRYA